MSDELDPNLLRRFAQADESLPGADFQANVLANLPRAAARLDITYELGFMVRAALAGIAAGILAPFRMSYGLSGFRIRTSMRM